MPTIHEFEDAAIDYCLNTSGVGVWVMQLEQVSDTVCDVAVRMGGRYRRETKGVATIRVVYYPQQRHFICVPADPILSEFAVVDDSTYLMG